MKKAGAIILWALASCIGFPLLILLVWLLTDDGDFSLPGIFLLTIFFALVVYSGFALLRFVARN